MLITALLLLAPHANADDPPPAWNRFRGPNGSGTAHDARIPDALDLETNLAWRTELGPGYSSPVLAREVVLLTAEDGDGVETLALDRASGEVRWRTAAPDAPAGHRDSPNSRAPCTPTTDGENAYVFFEASGLLSYDAKGELRWQRRLGEFRSPYGMGTSPILVDGLVVLQCDHDAGSFLVAVDAATGEERWRADRAGFTHGFSTPAVFRPEGAPAEIVTSGSYQICGYSATDGENLWRFSGVAWQAKCAPVIAGETAYVSSWMASPEEIGAKSVTQPWDEALAERDADEDGLLQEAECEDLGLHELWFLCDLDDDGALAEGEWELVLARDRAQNGLFAIGLGGRGDVTESHARWSYRRSLPNIPSPLLHDGIFYVLKEGGILTALDPATGERLSSGRVEGAEDDFYASPVAAGERLLVASQPGRVAVLRAGADFEVLSVLELDEEIWATPALAGGRVYLRTLAALYAFEAPLD